LKIFKLISYVNIAKYLLTGSYNSMLNRGGIFLRGASCYPIRQIILRKAKNENPPSLIERYDI